MEASRADTRNARKTVFVTALILTVFAGMLASGPSAAEVRDAVSTPDAVQYGDDGGGIDASASDAALTATQAFQEPGGGVSGGSYPESAPNGVSGASIDATPASKTSKTAGTGHATGLTELPDTGGAASAAPVPGGALVAGGLLAGTAARRRRR